MSESEYTGPRWSALLFPVSRRKLSMRPFASSSLPMEGMLVLTLVSRRGDQKPLSMVTACTGTLCSLAWGDSARFRIPWSRQAGLLVCATESCSCAPMAASKPCKSFCAPGSTEMAEADTAEATNSLREYFCLAFMVALLPKLPQTALIIAQQRPGVAASIRVLLFSVPLCQYLFPRKFQCHKA